MPALILFLCSCSTDVSDLAEPIPAEASQLIDSKDEVSLKGLGFVADNPKVAKELSLLRTTLANIRTFEDVMDAGWNAQLTDWWVNMGYHYGNMDYLLDGEFVIDQPEAILISCAPNGDPVAVGVEYLIPSSDPTSPPEGFSGDADVWSYNSDLSLWTLHCWIKKPNPSGIFMAMNPEVPAEACFVP
ncbi:hypothetical protein DMZ48_16175 [Robertkochia solimangrovi]|nr:hypothetical protein DMZ48_16175 [Robertkochia solimangrovi]